MENKEQAQIEIVYGLLWLMDVDIKTTKGMAAHLARRILLGMVDADGQVRGIEIAKRAVRGKLLQNASSRTIAEANYSPRAGND